MRTMRRNHIFIGFWLVAVGIGMASCLSGGQLPSDRRLEQMGDAGLAQLPQLLFPTVGIVLHEA